MNTNLKKTLLIVAISSVFAASTAQATNGYFAHGYGTKNKALAGGGSALPQDAMIAASNPAGMVWVGERMDLGAAIFAPLREYTVSGSPPNAGPPTFDLQLGTVESDSNIFLVPHFARNWMLDSESSIGVSVYGNGGMNTNYPLVSAGTGPTAGPAPGTYYAGKSAGIDLAQLFINTTYARKLDNKSSYGVSLIAVYQRFKAEGLASFIPNSSAPGNLSDVGYDDSMGLGAKLGWQGEVSPDMTVAASYQTKMSMGKFDKYAGLFAEQGDFDIPASWTVGLAYDIASAGTVTFDVQSIMFSDVKSVGNKFLPAMFTSLLGNNDGAGFGYEDIMVYKFGYQWSTNSDMTWRAGLSFNEQPVPNSEVLFNILAPAVIEQHLTGGFTMKTSSNSEFNFAAMYAPSSSVIGDNPLSGSPADGNFTAPLDQKIELEMSQWEFEASWAWKY